MFLQVEKPYRPMKSIFILHHSSRIIPHIFHKLRKPHHQNMRFTLLVPLAFAMAAFAAPSDSDLDSLPLWGRQTCCTPPGNGCVSFSHNEILEPGVANDSSLMHGPVSNCLMENTTLEIDKLTRNFD
jgi:hypothetical protein